MTCINILFRVMRSKEVLIEKEGLVCGIQFITDNNLEVETLITDRHGQVTKLVCEKHEKDNTQIICGMWLRVKYFNAFIVVICIKFLGFKKKIHALAKKGL